MTVGVPREEVPGERRVAATPESATRLIELGFKVIVARDAGRAVSPLEPAADAFVIDTSSLGPEAVFAAALAYINSASRLQR